jgi:hypothetical protein
VPWTFAHPAAVLPLRRWSKALPFLGLVIGSLSPDFGYYTRQFDLAKQAHSVPGLFLLCLPAGLAVAALVMLFGRVVVELLPQPHRHALSTLAAGRRWPGLRGWLALCAAVVVGASTHVVWDSFTHSHGAAVQQWAFLQAPLVRIGDRSFLVYNTLQHASSVLGATCLVVAYVRWLRRLPPPAQRTDDGLDRVRYAVLAACVVASVLVAVPLAYAAIEGSASTQRGSLIVVHTVIYATTCATVLTVGAALAWAVARRGRGPAH